MTSYDLLQALPAPGTPVTSGIQGTTDPPGPADRANKGWLAFPGGELEGQRPRTMCPACRERAHRTGTLCFQCYRVELNRARALQAAADLDTASDARFQWTLPFEPVNRPRLNRLKVERTVERAAVAASQAGRAVGRVRQAQMAARRVLEQIARGARESRGAISYTAAVHAAELQLPESWLPFVAAR